MHVHVATRFAARLRDADQVKAAVVPIGLLWCRHRVERRARAAAQQLAEAAADPFGGLGVGVAARVVVLEVAALVSGVVCRLVGR